MKDNKVRISLELTEELNNKIKQLAKDNEISVNALIRLALIEYLKKEVAEHFSKNK